MKAGRLQHVGLVIEQHPDRTRLFMQWKQMDWPFMIDPFNLMNLRLVPVTLAIDEYGITRAVHPQLDRADEFEELFVNATFVPPQKPAAGKTSPPDLSRLQAATPDDDAQALADYAVALTLWGDEAHLNEAIAISEKALSLQDDDRTHFNLGVIYRMRYDSALRKPDDFVKAVEHWTAALDYDPNNYVWRRRLQQYGPRLDKPYPFYDWVPAARDAIRARGETPIALSVEPGGAEFAQPMKEFSSSETPAEPDPDGRIYRDDKGLIDVETAVVPPAVTPGDSVRVHVVLRPNDSAHWNNEVEDTVLWVNAPPGWDVDASHQTVPNPPQVTSRETRRFEFEVRTPEDAEPGAMTLATYALYYICEDIDGVCLYRRRDIDVPLTVNEPDGRRLRDGG